MAEETFVVCVTQSGTVTVKVSAAVGVTPDEVRAALSQAAQDAQAAVN